MRLSEVLEASLDQLGQSSLAARQRQGAGWGWLGLWVAWMVWLVGLFGCFFNEYTSVNESMP